MTILSSHSSSNLTTDTVHNCTVDDIDDISEGNDGENVTEPDTEEPHSNKWSDSSYTYWPENQLGLPENNYWGVCFSDFDEESNKQHEFLFNCRDGLNWWFNRGDVKYTNAGVQLDPVTGNVKYASTGVQVDPVPNSSGSKIAADFFPKSEETVSETYLLTFLDLRWLSEQYFY